MCVDGPDRINGQSPQCSLPAMRDDADRLIKAEQGYVDVLTGRTPSISSSSDAGDLSDWMGNILADDLPIAAVSLPGTHNSASFAIGQGWRPIIAAARCQARDLSAQLRMGVRFLDLRVKPNGALSHGPINCGILCLQDAFSVFSAFLRMHPGEAILVRIKNEDGKKASGEAIASLIRPLADVCPLFLEPRLPTVGEVRGHVVVLCDWLEPQDGLKNERFGLLWNGEHLQIQDEYRHNCGQRKWHVVVQRLSSARPSKHQLYVNFTSATSLPRQTPLSLAKVVNPQLARYLRTTPPCFVGILAMDFPSASLCELIIRRNHRSLDPCRPFSCGEEVRFFSSFDSGHHLLQGGAPMSIDPRRSLDLWNPLELPVCRFEVDLQSSAVASDNRHLKQKKPIVDSSSLSPSLSPSIGLYLSDSPLPSPSMKSGIPHSAAEHEAASMSCGLSAKGKLRSLSTQFFARCLHHKIPAKVEY
jgi:1-phosphatidylinositol phosphodiesterase